VKANGLTLEWTLRSPRHERSAGTEPAVRRDGKIPRVTRLLALAIKFQGMVDRGEVPDYADLARLGYVTRARVTQIMNLLNLAPDIQEKILFMPETRNGRDLVTERRMRQIAAVVAWNRQRRVWHLRETAS
jgi:hypothetical protein